MSFKYRVKEGNDDFKQSVIEKSNVTVDFTLLDLEAHERRLEKALKEWRANYDLKSAEMENIAHFHKFVVGFSDEELHAINLYAQAKQVVDVLAPKIKEVEDAIEEYKVQKADIYEQLGFVETPYAEEGKQTSDVEGGEPGKV